ncbi:site-specific DNA-methyltransferase [Corynebacterium variabile]|uniref:site-specific DNA-methyltransferase n=1 Tax=Corynebacterium variabile TaxID=1727 RepID=UPI003FD217FC
MTSPDLSDANIGKLAELFPTVITETTDADGNVTRAVDFDLLRQELSDHIVEGPQERYRLDWPGKRKAAFTANTPIAKTLRPDRGESVDFDTTKNLFIEGDNLEALKLLQESYLGKVKMIYIDPPYNTGHDFVYHDDFSQSREEYMERSGQYSEEGERLVANPESSGRFHSDWLSMMYPRLKLARNLLSENGVIVISIGDSEVANLRSVASEIFGQGNFVGQLIWEKKKKGAFLSGSVSNVKEYILCFARNRQKFEGFIGEIARDSETYPVIKTTNSRGVRTIRSGIRSRFRMSEHYVPAGTRLTAGNQEIILKTDLKIVDSRLAEDVTVESNWIYSQELLDEFAADDSLYVTQDLYFRRIVTEPRRKVMKDLLTMRGSEGVGSGFVLHDDLFSDGWGTNEDGFDELHSLFGLQGLMTFPKPTKLIAKLVVAACRDDKESIIMDFFGGSGTAGDAVMQVNSQDGGSRKFIIVQLNESTGSDSAAKVAGYEDISSLARDRLRLAADKIKSNTCEYAEGVDVGFRSLYIDSSNMAGNLRTPDNTEQLDLSLFEGSIKGGRTGEDLLFQVFLDWGLDLSMPISKDTIDGSEVFFVEDDALAACFDDEVSLDVVREMAKRQPLRVVFRDDGFANDAARINVEQIFRELSPDTDVKAI